ncbi:MAG TPA: glycosyltransferase family 4 protein [Terriglobia bacterium]|nr:glycosyltransferase family 4 protein [Terriglobia bacterium]
MKVLLVHNSYQQPGGEDIVFEQERRLLESAGHDVVTYRRSNWEIVAYSALRRLALAPRTIWNGDSRQEVLDLLRREKPELVHVHNTFIMISPAIFSACREAGVPVVQTLHNYRFFCPAATFFRSGKVCEECLDHTLWRGIRHACYHGSRTQTAIVALMLAVHQRRETWSRGVDGFICLSEFARSKFMEGGLPAEKMFVKPNFVHPDPGARSGDGDYALFVGRLSPEKRVSTLLAAWSRLPKPIPLLVVGGGPEREELEAQTEELNLSSVRFQGQLSRPQTLAAVNGARFLVFSSEWYENFPVTIAEAYACSTAVICSRLGAMQEIVDDGRTGLHFNPGDPDDLARKVDWAWDHPDEIREMGRQARREYETKYTAEKNYPMLMEIYQRTIAAYGRANPN